MNNDWRNRTPSYSRAVTRKDTHKHLIVILAMLLCGLRSPAQPPDLAAAQNQTATTDSGDSVVTVPPGTRIPLQIMRPIATRLARLGDSIDLQSTVPVSIGDKVVFPEGTYVKGVLAKLTRARERTELQIQLNTVLWPNGYALVVPGVAEVVKTSPGSIYEHPDYGTAGNGKAAGVFAGSIAGGALIGALAGGSGTSTAETAPPPVISAPTPTIPFMPGPNLGTSLPPLPPLPGSGRAKGLIIGTGIGAAVGGVIAFIIADRSRPVILDVGTPADLILQNPLTVDMNRAGDSGSQQSPRTKPIVKRGGCARGTGIPGTPGSPGTPDTVIPGTPEGPPIVIPGAPGTPDIVVPGSPGTPPMVIPGMPGTPGTPAIPCVPVP